MPHSRFLLLLVLAAGASPRGPEVTPVRGPSWLQQLGVELDDTRMGKMGGEGPPPSTTLEPTPSTDGEASGLFALGGADLYRLECRACHGPEGRGAPPEINSLLDAVRATSPALLEARQRKQGRRLPPGMAEQLAADARTSLRDRIANGGKRMPAFPQLAGNEVDALVSHLEGLAGVPGARWSKAKVAVSAAHAGELLVKGTCHVCHPATGPTPSHMTMYMRGVIPPLASLPEQVSASGVIGKVREGVMAGMGGGMMGGRGMMGRMGRMPVFSYLTDEEVTAAYGFLSRYPPEPR